MPTSTQSYGPFHPNQIYCGDCAVLLKQLPDQCIDLTVTSPPYDNMRTYDGYTFDFPTIAAELYRVTKLGGVVVWVVGDETKDGSESGTSFRQALYFMEIGLNLHDTMIYKKVTGATGSNKSYWQSFEYMFVFSKGTPKTINLISDRKNESLGGTVMSRQGHRYQNGEKKPLRMITRREYGIRNNIWEYHYTGEGGVGKIDHPAKFPLSLARDHIISWSSPGDMILDPMCGSGTTLRMAKFLERNYIGFDISEKYCELARIRLEQTENPLPLLTKQNE